MTHVALLWHMHQPYYEDLVTREHILPWVRLHALKDYYGMVALLREFPNVKMTFNLVPSLLVQLEAFAENRAYDRFLEVGLKPAVDLTEQDGLFIVENFFHAQRQRMIEIYPRYAELLALRGEVASVPDAEAARRRFSSDDFRDLQVWQKLAWIDPFYLDGDARIRALVTKGRHFSEADKLVLREVELELLNAVVPEYRAAAQRGQIEVSASPFYHPILPLLCDSEIYKRTHPHSAMPRERFQHSEDAVEQLTRARACHERLFGVTPRGLWPSEGSVSDAMVPLVSQAGFHWMATDEQILGRTLNLTFTRDSHGHLEQPERLYTPYTIATGGARVSCLFRDHVLSDLIGFTYAGWNPEDAAQDFVGRIVEAGRRYSGRTGGGEALIPIILDGENAWEHFEGGGRPFLRALYQRLGATPGLTTVTMDEACRRQGPEVGSIFPGSWIDSNFYIWMGHQDDHRAWGQLGDARRALDRPGQASPETVARAREEVFIAEGSDWFWWYGDDHSSDHDEEFDDLFRRHLRNVYRLLEQPVPDELFASNISTAVMAGAELDPTAILTPTIDGEETSYFEWLGAGEVEEQEAAGAMHQTTRRGPILTRVRYGFDRERLFVRLDSEQPVIDLVRAGFEFSLKFLKPDAVRFSVRLIDGHLSAAIWDRRPEPPHWFERQALSLSAAAAGQVLEMALPLAEIGAADGVSFFVAVYDRQSAEVERHPARRPIHLATANVQLQALYWTA